MGTTYLHADFNTPTGSSHTDDWVLTAQIFAGLAYHVNDNFELFGGARWLYFDEPDFKGVSLDDDIMIEGGLRFYFCLFRQNCGWKPVVDRREAAGVS